MIGKLVSKKLYNLLAILLAVQVACVLPGIANISEEDSSAIEKTPTPHIIYGSLPELPSCEDETKLLAIVLASDEGGLNVRSNPLDKFGNGGVVISTLKTDTHVEVIRKNHTEGWDFIRISSDCGYVNNKYLLYIEKPLGE